MKITINRTGGYAGITETLGVLDTEKTDPKTAAKIADILKNMEFFNLPSRITGAEIGADFLRYEINVSDDKRKHSVNFPDDNSENTSQLKILVDIVQQKH